MLSYLEAPLRERERLNPAAAGGTVREGIGGGPGLVGSEQGDDAPAAELADSPSCEHITRKETVDVMEIKVVKQIWFILFGISFTQKKF